ncbi:hypothetical protein JW916_02320 [Candidatus Sumerlaeota bacterium]|nr:hypothetical protein [Candidatus Sumerlaeota bacterium]
MNIRFIRGSGARSLLGLSFDGPTMTACVVRLSAGRPEIVRSCTETLALDPLSGEPVLAGREIRSRLDLAGIRERRCVVCIPLKWALTMQTDVPDLSKEDEESFLRIQAERGFPFALEDLVFSVSRWRAPDRGSAATLAALPANRLAALESTLKAARLRPVGITFSLTSAVGDAPATGGSIVLLVGDNNVELGVQAGGGVAALRSIDRTVEHDAEGTHFDGEGIARELRITLGQIPETLRESISTVRVYGPDGPSRLAGEALRRAAARLRLDVEIAHPFRDAGLGGGESLPSGVSPAASLAAARALLGARSEFEFLLPRPSRLQRLTTVSSRRGVVWLAGAAAALVVLAVFSFAVQAVRLSYLERKWRSMESRVQEIEDVQRKVRDFRPWFDDSARTLTIALRLTESFPEEGSVWATSLDIRESGEISCTGQARSDSELLEMLKRLRNTQGIRDLKLQQVQGASPLKFSLSYRDALGEGDGI